EFNRYRHNVQWARFNTTAAVEGGSLYGAYQISTLSAIDRIGLLATATILVALIFLLVLADEKDSAAHVKRIRAYEADYPFERRHAFWGKWPIRTAMVVIML